MIAYRSEQMGRYKTLTNKEIHLWWNWREIYVNIAKIAATDKIQISTLSRLQLLEKLNVLNSELRSTLLRACWALLKLLSSSSLRLFDLNSQMDGGGWSGFFICTGLSSSIDCKRERHFIFNNWFYQQQIFLFSPFYCFLYRQYR